MPKKTTDPFIGDIWDALVADKLGPGGQQTGWAETPVRIRNRFTQAVRSVMQSGAAFQASMVGSETKKTGRSAGKKTAQKSRTERDLLLPLMTNVSPNAPGGERPIRKTKR